MQKTIILFLTLLSIQTYHWNNNSKNCNKTSTSIWGSWSHNQKGKNYGNWGLSPMKNNWNNNWGDWDSMGYGDVYHGYNTNVGWNQGSSSKRWSGAHHGWNHGWNRWHW